MNTRSVSAQVALAGTTARRGTDQACVEIGSKVRERSLPLAFEL
jgi:hypothetical protein